MQLSPYVDITLIILASLLLLTLLLYLTGAFPYPYGLFILLIFLVARVLHIRASRIKDD